MKRTRIDIPPNLTFLPVPRRASVGGWSPQRQREFISVLAATGSVAQAAAAVGMSKTGAYLLRNAKGGRDFRRAWDAAIEDGVAVLKSVAYERAVDGVQSTVLVEGKPVRTMHHYDNAMLMRLLAIYDTPERAAARRAAREPKFDRQMAVDKFRKLARKLAAEPVEETEAVTGISEADAMDRLYGVPGQPGSAPRPNLHRRARLERAEPPIDPPDIPPFAQRDAPDRWERPEPPTPRIWTG
ncbi:hypothetical protein EUV02_13390 [Polymorphobacter arshaanensis]|uniref:Terminase n=1 Tax=Glacieibacterium arshaanense TaxID=2511025 RepID=A0A4Y9EM69_9SPHN|nr:hypothetical protein [Polymorphobacter arshaanensis]TFU01285.1 hypothetical protein EUV02_13390 [Polymorphobacter arshaanensis]